MCQEGQSLEQVKYTCARTQSWKAPTCRNFCLRIQFCTDSRKILCGVSSQGDGRCQTCQAVSNWIPQRLETVFQPWLPPVSSNTLDAPSLAQDNVHSSGLPWGPKMTHLFSFILLVLYSISKDTKPSLLRRLPTLQSFYFLVYGGRSGFFGWLCFLIIFTHVSPALGDQHKCVILPIKTWTPLGSPRHHDSHWNAGTHQLREDDLEYLKHLVVRFPVGETSGRLTKCLRSCPDVP